MLLFESRATNHKQQYQMMTAVGSSNVTLPTSSTSTAIMETAAAAAAAAAATTSTSTSTTATNSKSKKRHIDDILQTFSQHMDRMDVMEGRMKHRCQAARRRILQLMEQQYQQQLYGIDSYSSMNTSTGTGSTIGGTGTGTSSSTDPTTLPAFPTAALEPGSSNSNSTNNTPPLVSTLPYTRNSHVRMYIHHSYQPQVTAAGAMAALMQKQQHTTTGGMATATSSQRLCKPSPPMWTLHIEGKLLIDHLDYQSAQIRDASKKRNESRTSSNNNSNNRMMEADPIDKLCSNVPLKFTHLFNKVAATFQTIYVLIDPKMKSPVSTKNSGKKSRRHVQNDNSPQPSGHNTLMDDTKESYSGGHHHNSMHQGNSSDNEYKSKIQQVIWTLQQDHDIQNQKNATAGGGGTAHPTNNTGADLWSFSYTEPTVGPEFKLKYKVHSVVAVLELYRRYNYYNTSNTDTTTTTATTATTATTTTTRYHRIVSSVLQKSLFPHHGPTTNDILTGTAPIHHHATSSKNILDQLLSSTHNQVHIPLVLTIHEIIQTFFVYIQDHHLIIPNDDGKTNGDVVQCDTTLQQLLNMEQFSFSQLRTLLHQRQLIEPVMNHNGNSSSSPVYDPVRITYIMEQDAASTSLFPTLVTTTPPLPGNATDDNSNLSSLQFDMDIYVPHYMMYRLYEILQRLKLREQEYASCRMKGRLRLQSTLPSYIHDGTTITANNNTATNNMSAQARRLAQQAALTARDDEERHVRNCIDVWIQQQQSSMDGNESSSSSAGGNVDMIPFVPLTLAQCATANSEAQQVYQIDTRIEYLLQQLDSPSSTLISNIHEIRTMLNHMLA